MNAKIIFFSVCLSSCTPAYQKVEEIKDYEYIDLKLPSGLLWATCNIGAREPYEYGDYFSWGEVCSKDKYNVDTYKWYENGNGQKLTKYCIDKDFGSVDGKCVLELEDDAINMNWGDPWRMPTEKEAKELLDGCQWTLVSKYRGLNVHGYIGVSKINNDTIFFPLSGHKMQGLSETFECGEYGGIWTSTNSDIGAFHLGFSLDTIQLASIEKSIGCTIRGVRQSKK